MSAPFANVDGVRVGVGGGVGVDDPALPEFDLLQLVIAITIIKQPTIFLKIYFFIAESFVK